MLYMYDKQEEKFTKIDATREYDMDDYIEQSEFFDWMVKNWQRSQNEREKPSTSSQRQQNIIGKVFVISNFVG